MDYTPRLKKKYNEEIVSNLKGNYKSIMQVPKLVKIIIIRLEKEVRQKLIDFAQRNYIVLDKNVIQNLKGHL